MTQQIEPPVQQTSPDVQQTGAPLAHDRARYRRGCRCGICREANRAYQRKYRKKPALSAVSAATTESLPSAPPASTMVVDAVQRQLDILGATEDRPGMAAIAIRLAELLDDPLAMPQHPAAAGRLVELLVSLSKRQQPQVRLSAVRSMTKRPVVAPRP